jgi:hypothetical protein
MRFAQFLIDLAVIAFLLAAAALYYWPKLSFVGN